MQHSMIKEDKREHDMFEKLFREVVTRNDIAIHLMTRSQMSEAFFIP